jgi:hypothetical protein
LSIKELGLFLDQLDRLLAPGGKVAFLENLRGGRALFWIRRNFIWQKDRGYEDRYYGIRPSQIPLFRDRFADVTARRPRYFIYEIFGRKKARG